MQADEGKELPIPGRILLTGSSTGLSLRCDAAAVRQGPVDVIVLLSVAGPESSVKALRAMLHQDTKVDIRFTDMPGGFSVGRPQRHPNGYVVKVAQIAPGYWHALALAKEPGLMPAASEEALWQQLHGPRFTTPLLRSWLPWLSQQLAAEGGLANIRQVGCQCGIVSATDGLLDRLVSDGIKNGNLKLKKERS